MDQARGEPAWLEFHQHLAGSVKDAKLIMVDHSTHLVPDEQPEIILSTAGELVGLEMAVRTAWTADR